jgi:NAD(P)H-dependent FMN reductase
MTLQVAVILGSTRPSRVGQVIAPWVIEHANRRTDATFTLVDLAEVHLPFLDEPLPPAGRRYEHQHSKDWAATIASFDAFVFIAPEYNHSISGALKNAIDFVYYEWNNKAAGFVSYGVDGGIRAVEHLRLVMAEMQVATVRAQVKLDSYRDFENYYNFKPTEQHVEQLNLLFDQVVSWGEALKPLRS